MSEDNNNEIEVRNPALDAVVDTKGIQFTKLDQMWWYCRRVIESNMAPKDCKSASDILVRAQCGMSCGLNFMASIQYVSNVNGRPRLWGPPVKGLILASGLCKKWVEKAHGDDPMKDDFYWEITIERRDLEGEQTVRFGTRDAKRAGLMGRDTYKQYPEDMILYRATGRVATRHFPDVIHGIFVAEDARDIIDVEASPADVPPIPPRTLDEIAAKAKRGRKATAPLTEEPNTDGEVRDDGEGFTEEDTAPWPEIEFGDDDNEPAQASLC